MRDEGKTVLLVEQNAKAALTIADRGYVLETGKVILQGAATDLLANRVRSACLSGPGKNRVTGFMWRGAPLDCTCACNLKTDREDFFYQFL